MVGIIIILLNLYFNCLIYLLPHVSLYNKYKLCYYY
uniref:Uncharacterized protein n=1 Tax=Kuetzingia canaliculata TaxID=228262 RepID=A0A1Z1MPT8_KUECA|nr:hypothetical protein [Kuetzingia canaliculata]ARW67764.1 hypothetical protein [Kuetzingia canaliculata]